MAVNFTALNIITISSTSRTINNYFLTNFTTTPISATTFIQQNNSNNFSSGFQKAALRHTTISNQLNVKQQPYLLNILELWATISHSLWWIVVCVSVLSIPILGHALCLTLRRYKKTNYSYFFITMIILNVVMLLSIIFNLISDTILQLKGNFTCKLTAFITNVTSCYSNWLWVVMFAQRFVHIFYPMHYAKVNKVFRILNDTRQLILLTGIMSFGSQLWAPFLMREIFVYSAKGLIEGSYCGPDSTLINQNLFKWIAAMESAWTYAIPFLITLLTDIAVLFCSKESKRFTTVCAEDVSGGNKFSAKKSSFSTHLNESIYNPAPNRVSKLIKSNAINKISLIHSNNADTLNHNRPTKTKMLIFGILFKNTQLSKQLNVDTISSTIPLLKTSTTSNITNLKPLTQKMSTENLIPKLFRHNNLSMKTEQKHHAPILTALKIQSENSLRACHRRRQRAIRRCLMLATMQLLLNLPNYVLQLVDEFTLLRQTSRRFAVFYLYADAIFYLFYLSQYPMIAVYVRWFHNNMGLAKSTPSSQNHSCSFRTNSFKQNFSSFFNIHKPYNTSNHLINQNNHANTNISDSDQKQQNTCNLSCSLLTTKLKLARSNVKSEKYIIKTSNAVTEPPQKNNVEKL